MMMSKKSAMARMMACRTLAMPLTIAMRQLPIVRRIASTQDTTAPILDVFAMNDFDCLWVFGWW